jgi:hypothetical protein
MTETMEREEIGRGPGGWAGLAVGGTVGLFIGLGVAALGPLLGVLGGSVAGVLVGLRLSRLAVVERDPGKGHPFVGASAPDDDLAQPR